MKINFLNTPLATKRTTGKVTAKAASGWWIVEDRSGHRYRAASSKNWRVGNSVVVINGQIVDKGATGPDPVVFNV
jgi:hypothetical protein